MPGKHFVCFPGKTVEDGDEKKISSASGRCAAGTPGSTETDLKQRVTFGGIDEHQGQQQTHHR
ncbi:MAG: hypothetical protein Q4E67_04975, partial [Planctomycetia bacterium]|nr:hypothetical protein [Planctomycetia bacterium]